MLISAVAALERLTETKALVMRHLYTQRLYYLPFLEAHITKIGMGLIAFVSLLMVYRYRSGAWGLVLVALAISMTLLSDSTKSWMTYPYALAVLLACWFIEICKVAIRLKKHSHVL